VTTTLQRESGTRGTAYQPEFRGITRLVGIYFFVSLATLAGIVLLRNDSALVTPAVWIRGTIVAASSLLTVLFAARAARGSRSGYLRLRIASAVMVVALVAIAAIPGAFPVWLRVEQGFCAAILLGVVLIANSPRIRALFAK
jgi:hypothetical protein